MPVIRPIERAAHWLVHGRLCDEDVLLNGVTEQGDMTGVANQLEAIANENSSDLLRDAAAIAYKFPPLPDSGWLEAGAIYQHGERAVIVRQSHNRTEHDPTDVPALFLVYREGADAGKGRDDLGRARH